MTDISVLAIVREGREQLHHLLRGIADQQCSPREVVLVFMNEAIPTDLPDPGCVVYLYRLDDPSNELPLAAARNRAAAEASGETLAFLDIACVPDPDYISKLEEAVCFTQGLIAGNVYYPPEGAEAGKRTVIKAGGKLFDLDYTSFRSLAFGIRQKDFARLGGFNEDLTDSADIDADFALAAKRNGLSLYGCDARAHYRPGS